MIRPGSVKQARAEAGLSLGQVAQGDISRTAIYFVETGKAKPSLETLQLIATRTNKPLDFFLGQSPVVEEEMAVAEIERLVQVGENSEAVTAGETLLAKGPAPAAAARARFFMSNALIRLGRAVEGRGLAAAARVYFDQAGDVLMTAECLGWEAGAAQLLRDSSALGLIEEALARCRSLKPIPNETEARLLSILGHTRLSRHEYSKAIEAYEESLALDADTPDLRRLSYIYGSLMLAYEELGEFAKSERYAKRSMALFETLRDNVSMVMAQNNLALLRYKQGELGTAFRHAETALRMSEELGTESGKTDLLLTLAELELARSRHQSATNYATQALELAQRTGETVNAGEAHMWLARIAAGRRDDGIADSEFQVAFQIFESAGATEWLARSHYVYAEILEARGDLAAANRSLRQAMTALGMPSSSVTPGARVAIA